MGVAQRWAAARMTRRLVTCMEPQKFEWRTGCLTPVKQSVPGAGQGVKLDKCWGMRGGRCHIRGFTFSPSLLKISICARAGAPEEVKPILRLTGLSSSCFLITCMIGIFPWICDVPERTVCRFMAGSHGLCMGPQMFTVVLNDAQLPKNATCCRGHKQVDKVMPGVCGGHPTATAALPALCCSSCVADLSLIEDPTGLELLSQRTRNQPSCRHHGPQMTPATPASVEHLGMTHAVQPAWVVSSLQGWQQTRWA